MASGGNEAMEQSDASLRDPAVGVAAPEEQLGEIARQLAELADRARLLSLEPLDGPSSTDG